MIKTVYNANEDAYRAAELKFIKEHSASEQSNDKGFSPLKAYALIQERAGLADSNLERLLEKSRADKNSDFNQFVQAHSASVVKAVQAQNASEKRQNGKSDFMKHYKLVNMIGGRVEIE